MSSYTRQAVEKGKGTIEAVQRIPDELEERIESVRADPALPPAGKEARIAQLREAARVQHNNVLGGWRKLAGQAADDFRRLLEREPSAAERSAMAATWANLKGEVVDVGIGLVLETADAHALATLRRELIPFLRRRGDTPEEIAQVQDRLEEALGERGPEGERDLWRGRREILRQAQRLDAWGELARVAIEGQRTASVNEARSIAATVDSKLMTPRERAEREQARLTSHEQLIRAAGGRTRAEVVDLSQPAAR